MDTDTIGEPQPRLIAVNAPLANAMHSKKLAAATIAKRDFMRLDLKVTGHRRRSVRVKNHLSRLGTSILLRRSDLYVLNAAKNKKKAAMPVPMAT
ncbi:hypothetical protein RAE21_08680 [Rhodoferax sp. TBRC 17198]|uniref:hypothetical protein n=1 Tax=Rhodoferax potami TaxID=3068338 RepID=UPI0028BDF36E|nr:hypothetical protein [Rhodoferax sp. TBRC 17198]MDT7522482.1 hypothetical protein [Rhodoferax sp. TBRC 17198]